MEWFSVSAEAGLWGLALGSFLAATLLPGGSEALLVAFLLQHPEQWPGALALASVANTAGGMTSWWCGRALPRWQNLASLPQLDKVRRWGSPALLLAWAPLIGDALCVAAGWLKLHWLPCMIYMAIGKFARYALVAAAVPGSFN
ncbi:MAG: hypothetical protein RIR00_1760 [Pseudomonadota bacterium]|jgi:membrane protein YqaA with SNARE-associated domain